MSRKSMGIGPRVTQRRTIMGEIRPPPREQVEWQRVCTYGGPLLKLQVCAAAKGTEGRNWFIGRLFAAEAGLLVESTDEDEYVTPLLKWVDITDVHDNFDGKTKKYEVLVVTPSLKLRINLGSQFAVEWVMETYAASTAAVDRWFSFGTAGSSDSDEDLSDMVQMQRTWHPGSPAFDFTDDKVPDLVPLSAKAEKEKPFLDHLFPETTIAEVKEVFLKEQWPFVELLKGPMMCKDITMTPWKNSASFPSTQIRSSQYTLPLPKNPNIPENLNKLLGVPEFATVVSHWRFCVHEDKIVLMMQSGSKGVKHGDSLMIRCLMTWRQRGQDVIFTEHLDLIWVERLAFYVRPAKGFIEAQASSDAVTAANRLAEITRKDINKLRADSMPSPP